MIEKDSGIFGSTTNNLNSMNSTKNNFNSRNMTQDKFFSRQMANMGHTKSNFNNSFQFSNSQQIN